jgi:hypothetical protein
MHFENHLDSTDSDEEIGRALEASMRDVSISSIKTQDSIESNSARVNAEEEKNRELFAAHANPYELEYSQRPATPLLSFKETQIVINTSLAAPRIRLAIKSLSEISEGLHKLSEDFQSWKKNE